MHPFFDPFPSSVNNDIKLYLIKVQFASQVFQNKQNPCLPQISRICDAASVLFGYLLFSRSCWIVFFTVRFRAAVDFQGAVAEVQDFLGLLSTLPWWINFWVSK